MQKYQIKTPLALFSDKLFRIIAATVAGVGWFTALWGVSLAALAAGCALGGLLWICARQFTKQLTARREKQLRQMIGGELALDELLLEQTETALKQCLSWIKPRYPFDEQRSFQNGILGLWNGKQTWFTLLARHPSAKITMQSIISCVRKARSLHAEMILLCLTAPVDGGVYTYASALDPPVRLIGRKELIELAGALHPASDEVLIRMASQKKPRRSAKEWLSVVLEASRARRYFWYGTLLSLFAWVTGSSYYPIPAFGCLGLFALSKLQNTFFMHRSRHWKA